MGILSIVQIGVALTALSACTVVLWKPRLGRASYALAIHLLPAALVPLTLGLLSLLGPAYELARLPLTVACVCLSVPGLMLFIGQLSVGTANRRDDLLVGLIAVAGPLTSIGWLVDAMTSDRSAVLAHGAVKFGGWRFVVGTYLLVAAVSYLVQTERVLRAMPDRERWKLKFPLIGQGLTALAWLLIATRVLLYGYLRGADLGLVSFAVLFSSLFVLLGWRRLDERVQFRLSHSALYGSLTLAAVGTYLLLTSVAASWLQSLGGAGTEAAALVVLFALALLAAVLLSTEARGRLFGWVRRNFFRGRYDYRTFWLEADERIRDHLDSVDSALALTDLVRRGIGSIDVTVWLRENRADELRLVARLGAPQITGDESCTNLAVALESGRVQPADGVEDAGLTELLERAKASVYLPLRSGNDLVGLLTAGSDHSGRPFDPDAYDFLGVLGLHAAREFHKRDLIERQIETKQAEAFRDFATFVMHDLKNFASTLSMVARNAAKHGENPEFLRDAFSSVFDTAEKMRRLCNSLYTFAAPAETRPDVVDLVRLIRDVVEEVRPAFPGTIQLEDSGPLPVRGGEEAIRGVVRNLVMNAVEACDGSGTLRIRAEREGNWAVAQVDDDGEGIPEEFLANGLFQPFRTTKSDGLGIGLFQSKTVVDAHGGTIEVESKRPAGTRVTIRLPCAPAAVVGLEDHDTGESSPGSP